MTWIQMAKSIAEQYGIELDNEQADYFLWEETAFPVSGEEITRKQLHEVFSEMATTKDRSG